MPYSKKIRFRSGDTITRQRPGRQIKAAVDEIQKKSITDIESAVPGLAFERAGSNTVRLVRKSTGEAEDSAALLRRGIIKNDGAAGDAKIRYENGIYWLDITFPRVNRSTSVDIQSG